MFHFIEKLQNKPEHERRRLILPITIITFIAIVSVWVVILGFQFAYDKEYSNTHEEISPFANVIDIFSGVIQEIGGDIEELKTPKDLPIELW